MLPLGHDAPAVHVRATSLPVRSPGQETPTLGLQPIHHDTPVGPPPTSSRETCRPSTHSHWAMIRWPSTYGRLGTMCQPSTYGHAGPPRTVAGHGAPALHIQPLCHGTPALHVQPLDHSAPAVHVRSRALHTGRACAGSPPVVDPPPRADRPPPALHLPLPGRRAGPPRATTGP